MVMIISSKQFLLFKVIEAGELFHAQENNEG